MSIREAVCEVGLMNIDKIGNENANYLVIGFCINREMILKISALSRGIKDQLGANDIPTD